MEKKIENIAIYLRIPAEGLNQVCYKTGKFGDEIAEPKNPIYRYAKNYTKDKLKYSLILLSRESDKTKIEKILDKAVVSKEDILEVLNRQSTIKYIGEIK